MKKLSFIITALLLIGNSIFGRNGVDSLVLFFDLKYHSEFEEKALSDFINHQSDTFDLFLAVDEKMTEKEADRLRDIYMQLFAELEDKKISAKKGDKKIRIAEKNIQDHFLKNYNSSEYFPLMFDAGTYNYLSTSILYSLVFNRLEVPYKIMASPEHAYVVANPTQNYILLETKNPKQEKTNFSEEFKKQYTGCLHSSGLISESDYENYSVDEIFQAKFYQTKEVQFINLPGLQYYNKAIFVLLNKERETGYQLCQKAYFFYPDLFQVKTLLYSTLLLIIDNCYFDKVSDIDYLAQLLRFENTELNTVVAVFSNVIKQNLQFDKEEYCQALFRRLTSQIHDKTSLDSISFNYYMQMSYKYQNKDNVGNYVSNAIKIKGDHNGSNIIMENFIRSKLNGIDDPYALLDSVKLLKKKYDFERVIPVMEEYQMIASLRIANDLFGKKDINSGEEYLKQFEEICIPPATNQLIAYWIERAYRANAIYYFYQNDKATARGIIERGLKYVPGSELLKSAVY